MLEDEGLQEDVESTKSDEERTGKQETLTTIRSLFRIEADGG